MAQPPDSFYSSSVPPAQQSGQDVVRSTACSSVFKNKLYSSTENVLKIIIAGKTLRTIYNTGDQMKKTEINRPCSTYGERPGAYRVLVGKAKGRRPLGRPRRRWEDNIKIEFTELDRRHGLV
jgi:hypothetical protein